MILVGLAEIYAVVLWFYLIFWVIFFMCSTKFSFASKVNPRCFWNILFFKGMLLMTRVKLFLSFSAEYHVLRLFSQSRIKNHFPLKSSIAYYRQVIAQLSYGPKNLRIRTLFSSWIVRTIQIFWNVFANDMYVR